MRLCARCSGQLAGAVLMIVLLWATRADPAQIFAPGVQVAIAFAPLPAAIDWITQSMHQRESTNVLRGASGMLLGLAETDLLALLLEGRREMFLVGMILLGAYVGAIALTLGLSGAWRTVLAEHFPGIDR